MHINAVSTLFPFMLMAIGYYIDSGSSEEDDNHHLNGSAVYITPVLIPRNYLNTPLCSFKACIFLQHEVMHVCLRV